jgi:SAM-dependent methyltransferase
MSDDHYNPLEYWNRLVRGDGCLGNVGYSELGKYNEFAYRFRLRALAKALEGMDLSSAAVFEAAFGEGFYLRYWKSRGVRDVAGMDLSAAAAKAAKANFPDFNLRAGDLTRKSDFASFNRLFNIVTAIDVLYHIVDDELWRQAIANLLSLVDEDGIFIFTDIFPREQPYQKFPHVRRRPRRMWDQVLSSHGFELVRTFPVFFLMADPLTCGEHPWLGRAAMLQWRVGTKVIRMSAAFPRLQAALSAVYAGAQYLPEMALVNCFASTPSLQLAVYKRKSAHV